MSSTEEETTMTFESGGRKVGPMPLSALGKVGEQLAMFEGRSYPDVEIKLTGGLAGNTLDALPEITGQRIGEPFTLVVSGEIVAKKHQLKRDKEGAETRVLVVTLKVDDMREYRS